MFPLHRAFSLCGALGPLAAQSFPAVLTQVAVLTPELVPGMPQLAAVCSSLWTLGPKALYVRMKSCLPPIDFAFITPQRPAVLPPVHAVVHGLRPETAKVAGAATNIPARTTGKSHLSLFRIIVVLLRVE